MGHQRGGSLGNHGRGYGVPRRKKTKTKTREEKHRFSSNYSLEGNHVSTTEEVVDRTLSRLHNLGNQTFALSPFSEHFDRWLKNVEDVLSEFEPSSTINADDQFIKERSQIISNVKLELEERRHKEATGSETAKSLSNNRILLERIEEEYANRMKEIRTRKNNEVKRLSSNVEALKEELSRTAQTKTGIFRGISKNTKARREEEAAQRLNSAQGEIELAMKRFTTEEEKLIEEHERKKQPIIEMIRDQEKEIQNQEIDSSLDARKATCEALITSINALLQRKTSANHENQ